MERHGPQVIQNEVERPGKDSDDCVADGVQPSWAIAWAVPRVTLENVLVLLGFEVGEMWQDPF